MMTIDDAIKHEEERAADLESTCTLWKSLSDAKGLALPSDYEFCKSDAEDHRQVAAWLKELKVLKEAPKGDLISRKWLTDAIRNRKTYLSYEDAKDVIDLIDNVPTVDITEEQAIDKLHETGWLPKHDKEMTERPQGEWIEVDIKPTPYGGYTCNYKCNRCKYFTKEYHLNFCPNCGTDMRGAEE